MLIVVCIFAWQLLVVQSMNIQSEENSEGEFQYVRRLLDLENVVKMSRYITESENDNSDEEQEKRTTDSYTYAAKFAPQLRFDRATEGYPMSAQVYYEAYMNDSSSSFRKENTDKSTLSAGTIPTYYMVRTDGNQMRIVYWWFYGYQHPCWSSEGKHNGDWEHIMVILTEDKTKVAAVSFFQHDGHYTRISGPRKAPCTPSGTGRCAGSHGFKTTGDRPIVYVGKIAHGSYHDTNTVGPKGVGNCAYYADFRDPKSDSDYMDTSKKLIDLEGSDEAWLAADKTGGFSWGPSGISTHPTQKNPFDSTHSRACEGSPTYAVSSAGCYQSECLAGDDEASEDCLKQCKKGYTNFGLTCSKGVKTYGRLNKGKKYNYNYILPKTNAGLSRRRDSKSEWNLP
ncbi:hypothetical protein I4U23_017233 [Adineta vaga]|nr:hypothetical protein I4U23_017233 [Adineta vaga]